MKLAKIIFNDYGEPEEKPKWHLVQTTGDSPRIVCTGEVFGFGEGTAVAKEKTSEKGGITCPDCIKIIKWFKEIKL